ncbi:MAG: hypothetical protein AAFW97_14515 [Pseudomonadota bacterium]
MNRLNLIWRAVTGRPDPFTEKLSEKADELEARMAAIAEQRREPQRDAVRKIVQGFGE